MWESCAALYFTLEASATLIFPSTELRGRLLRKHFLRLPEAAVLSVNDPAVPHFKKAVAGDAGSPKFNTKPIHRQVTNRSRGLE